MAPKITFLKSFFLLLFFISFSAFSQDKKQTDAANDKKGIVYSPDMGRTISTAVAKKYIAVFPDYEKKLTLNKDKKTYLDKNDLYYIVKLQRANKIEDTNLEQILGSPENQQLIKDLKINSEPKKNEPTIAAPALLPN